MNQFVKSDIVQLLKELQKFFYYFLEKTIDCDWVRYSFSCLTDPFTRKNMEEFIELSSDGNLKLQFTNQLWINVENTNPTHSYAYPTHSLHMHI